MSTGQKTRSIIVINVREVRRVVFSCKFVFHNVECCVYHRPLEFGESSSDCLSDLSDWKDSSDEEK